MFIIDKFVYRLSYMITGANSGIGRSTALALAGKGATVHIVCRNSTRGEEAKQDIVSQTGNDVRTRKFSICCTYVFVHVIK